VDRPTGDVFLLFVYGTLKRGGCRHGLLARQAFRGEARTRPGYALHHLGAYPGLKPRPDGGQVVHGELYEVARSLLCWLDRAEGAPDLFELGIVEVENVQGPVWTYYYQRDAGGMPLVESGVWDNR
jgi:gamma-glutamylaminecyclotransferase